MTVTGMHLKLFHFNMWILSFFLPHDASAVFAVARCSSVCPSVTFVYCIQTVEDIVKLHSPRPGSPIILVFSDSKRRYPIAWGTPFSGCVRYTGVRKFFLRFSTKIAVYLGNATRRAHGCYILNVNKKL